MVFLGDWHPYCAMRSTSSGRPRRRRRRRLQRDQLVVFLLIGDARETERLRSQQLVVGNGMRRRVSHDDGMRRGCGEVRRKRAGGPGSARSCTVGCKKTWIATTAHALTTGSSNARAGPGHVDDEGAG